MRPVSGTSRRALHFMQTPQFKMPFGFNTPVEAANWLSSGSLRLRRSILAVIASLLLPTSLRSTWPQRPGEESPFGSACVRSTARRTRRNLGREPQDGTRPLSKPWISTGKGISTTYGTNIAGICQFSTGKGKTTLVDAESHGSRNCRFANYLAHCCSDYPAHHRS